MEYSRRFIVHDGEGDPIRKFYTKQDALAFLELRPECYLTILPKEKVQKPPRWNPEWEEAPF